MIDSLYVVLLQSCIMTGVVFHHLHKEIILHYIENVAHIKVYVTMLFLIC